jgi:hypothetical protein
MAISWANVKSLVYGVLGDVEGTNTFFSVAQVLDVANTTMREIGDRTHFYDSQETGVTQPQVAVLTNALAAYGFWRIEVNGHVVRPITSDKLRHTDKFWEAREGEPWFYLLDEFQTDPEYIKIRLYETPNDEYTYRILGYGMPTMPSDSFAAYMVHLPEWFAYSMAWGMLARMYAADTPMRNDAIAAFYRMIFDDAVMRLRIRSFSRLANEWEVDPDAGGYKYSIWDRIPSTITGP